MPRKGPLPFRYVFLITFIFFTFSTAGGLWIVNKGLEPTLMSYAETQTKKIATLVINKAVTKKIANVMDLKEIIITNNTGTTVFDTEKMVRIQSEVTNLIQANLKEAEQGDLSALELLTDVEIELNDNAKKEGIVYYVPLGQATNNALLGNLGPQIPVRFNAIGAVRSDIKPDIKEMGINNTFVTVYIHVSVDVRIIVPFATKVATIEQDIPVAMGLIPGKVPQFFNGNGNTSPSIEVPMN